MAAAFGGVAIGTYVAGPQPEVARLPISLPPRPPPLAGREQLLTELHELLTDGGGQPRLAVLCGLGGVGKTSLAAEYAHRHLAELGVAWQLAAENPAVLAAGMAELAAQLGGRTLADPRDPVASAHAVLAAYPADWLLIYDNAPDDDAVRGFLPPAGRGRVLITSQSQHWPGHRALNVPTLGDDVAARFLISRTGDPDAQAAAKLVAELGGLPLALEQAGAYIQSTSTTLAAYLAMFAESRAELLARGHAAGHPASVTTTLGLALSRLETDSPAAAGLLRLLACLASEPVPLTLLLQAPGDADGLDPGVAAALGPLLGDPLATADAVAALRQYSLATPAGNQMVVIHRLVQAITAHQMPVGQLGTWRQAATVLTAQAIPDESHQPGSWAAYAVLLPHAQALLEFTSTGMWNIARYLGDSGNYPAARDMFQQIADAYERSDAYGAENEDTLAARYQFATFTGRAGNPARARDQFATLIPVTERALGADHPTTLATRHQLATYTGEAGDPAAARDQLAALLPVTERVLGAENPSTLATRHQLATYTGDAGDPAAARDQLAALLPVTERVLGRDHRTTLTTRHQLASFTGDAGDPAAARDQLATLLAVTERALGTEHPSTLTTRHQLAGYTGEAGDAAGARDQFAALVPVTEKVLGADHPDTLATRHSLAGYTGVAGDAAGARDQFAALLPITERALGTDHPTTQANRRALEYWTLRQSATP